MGDKVVFLHRIARGGTNKSFGIEVAALAGVPADVCARAKDIATKLEKRQFTDTDSIVEDTIGGSNYAQMSLFDQPDDGTKEIINILRETNVERMTPVQAMLVLADLIERAKHE